MNVGCPDGCGGGLEKGAKARSVNCGMPFDFGVTAVQYAYSFLRSRGYVPRRLEVHPLFEFYAFRVLKEVGAVEYLPVRVNPELSEYGQGGWMVYGARIDGEEAGDDDRV